LTKKHPAAAHTVKLQYANALQDFAAELHALIRQAQAQTMVLQQLDENEAKERKHQQNDAKTSEGSWAQGVVQQVNDHSNLSGHQNAIGGAQKHLENDKKTGAL
jgi:methionine synthase II (cobalamin-independent)